MKEDSASTRERILQAALDIVGAEGLQALTTRRVAAEAGVNLGLVHYYFGSKSALANEAVVSFFSSIQVLALGGPAEGDPATALANMLGGALEAASRRPGLLFSYLGLVLEGASRQARETNPGGGYFPALGKAGAELDEGNPFRRFAGLYRLLIEGARAQISLVLGPDREALVKERTLRLFASILHPVLLTPLPGAFLGLALNNTEARKAYVRNAVADALRLPD